MDSSVVDPIDLSLDVAFESSVGVAFGSVVVAAFGSVVGVLFGSVNNSAPFDYNIVVNNSAPCVELELDNSNIPFHFHCRY